MASARRPLGPGHRRRATAAWPTAGRRGLPNLRDYCCVDAIPESTFLSEYYLALARPLAAGARCAPAPVRRAGAAGVVRPGREHPQLVRDARPRRCAGGSASCERLEVPHLFVVPNEPTASCSLEPDGSRRDLMPSWSARATGWPTRARDRGSGRPGAAGAGRPLPPVHPRAVVDTLELACAVDRHYVAHTAAMIHSVARHRGALALTVHVPPRRAACHRRAARRLARNGRAPRLLRPPSTRWTPSACRAWAPSPRSRGRCGTGSTCPSCCPASDRVLYLDGDMLAMDSLEPLWATDAWRQPGGRRDERVHAGDEHALAPGGARPAGAGRVLQQRGPAAEPRGDAP